MVEEVVGDALEDVFEKGFHWGEPREALDYVGCEFPHEVVNTMVWVGK